MEVENQNYNCFISIFLSIFYIHTHIYTSLSIYIHVYLYVKYYIYVYTYISIDNIDIDDRYIDIRDIFVLFPSKSNEK